VARRADDHPSIDEEARRAGDANAVSFVLRRLPRIFVLARGQALVELITVDACLRGEAIEVAIRERSALREKSIVHLPELPLLIGAVRGLGGALRGSMTEKRIVAEHDADVVAILLPHLLQRL